MQYSHDKSALFYHNGNNNIFSSCNITQNDRFFFQNPSTWHHMSLLNEYLKPMNIIKSHTFHTLITMLGKPFVASI